MSTVPPWAAELGERLDLDALVARTDALLADPLYWFPVRHHSPAVARHLESAIRSRKPKVLFLEAPAEAQALLQHVVDAKTKPPVALYTSFRDDANVLGYNGVSTPSPELPAQFSSWYPLLAYSPEYVALKVCHAVGCEVVFMDLPHHALLKPAGAGLAPQEHADEPPAQPVASWERLLEGSDFYGMLAEVGGYRSWEEGWDTIFESGQRLAEREDFRRELAYFCAALRATTSRERMEADGTIARERHMWRTIQGELSRRGLPPDRAMVASGGFHLFLDRGDTTPPPEPPPGTVYVTVAPYSSFRTSELAGYAAGNRAPSWYQALHDRGAHAAVEHIVAVLSRARKGGEGMSSADAIAAAQHARLLAALRGRPEPVLDDLRDAIVTCVVKGRPVEEGGHLLTAMRAVEIGNAVGRVTPALGRLPLVHDFYTQLDALELGDVMGKDKRMKVTVDRREALGLRQSVFFHRLAQLEIPLVARQDRGPKSSASNLLFRESWALHWSPKVEAALIEKVLYGDSVEAAAAGMLEEGLARDEVHAGRLCARLVAALDMDLPDLIVRLETSAGVAIDQDKRFVSLAEALTQLLLLERHAAFKKLSVEGVAELIRRCFGHACFELPSIAAAPEQEQEDVLSGLRAMAETVLADHGGSLDRGLFVEHLAKARVESPRPYLRGAFSGILSEIRAETAEALAERVAEFARERPEVMVEAGEFLDGALSASKTSILLGSGPLVESVDALFRAADWDAFITMLPRVRHAFEQLHERQRLSFCDQVAEKYGLMGGGAESVATLAISAGVAAEVARIDARVAEIMKDWSLG